MFVCGGLEGDIILPTDDRGVAQLGQPARWTRGVVPYDMSAITGFWHEQSRPDRDSYITVDYSNVGAGQEHNFNKYTWGKDVENQGFAYDYTSIMHYGATAFSTNGKPTMIPKQSGAKLGGDVLTKTDIAEIRKYYNCGA
ncbi:unnamed protein product [Didymodactylos carnosus]|uniref:Metalloendopeptidase n=1 Tax=Didymodactylos carnosus TaxID=1234261 RepID=A0A814CXK3_9BILA|nr:unnamed protein product [Didymodactylos carnosus]CAF0946714.1 unnamed protein product [Didymodactylos carnosus]CAF3659102.1 unnamed protein product [Didymodactylos carnosus]CAF3722841.1 unnamed protein product [Didymodactylos carnosus]